MTNTPAAVTADAAPKSLLGRFFGVITSPQATFRSVVAHPKWFGILALTTLVIALCAAAPMMTAAGQEAALTNQVAQMKTFGVDVNDQMYEAMRKGMSRAPYTAAAAIIVFTPVMAAIFTGILFAVFN